MALSNSDYVGYVLGSDDARKAYVGQQYQSLLGRAPTEAEMSQWSTPNGFSSATSTDRSFMDNLVGPGITANPAGSMPWDKTAAWDQYRAKAQAAQQGVNRMPGIFSDYGAIPTDAAARNALFYMAPEEATKAAAANPLLSGVISATGFGGNGQGGAPSGSQVPYGFYRSDDPMFNQAVRIGNEIVIDGVTYWEPI